MIVDPDSLKSAAKAMEYQEFEEFEMNKLGAGSPYVGAWDHPTNGALKYGIASSDDDVYNHDITEPISWVFSQAMKTAETLRYELSYTRSTTSRALEKIVENIGNAEDANESNAFKVFHDPH